MLQLLAHADDRNCRKKCDVKDKFMSVEKVTASMGEVVLYETTKYDLV